MIYHNIFFFQELRSEFHGPQNAPYDQQKTLEIPSDVFILGVRIFLGNQLRL